MNRPLTDGEQVAAALIAAGRAEAKLAAVEAVAVDMDRRANIRSSAYVRAKDVANAIRHALENR